MPTNSSTIDHILATTRSIAVVCLSSRSTRAGYYVPAYLQAHGSRIFPVNPFLDEALGEPAYPDLYALPQPVDLVLVFRLSRHIPAVVDAAIITGAKALWTQFSRDNPDPH